MTLQVLSAVLLVLLGLLLGKAWTTQVSQRRLGHQAEERRRLNNEWSTVRTIRRKQGECVDCGKLLSDRDFILINSQSWTWPLARIAQIGNALTAADSDEPNSALSEGCGDGGGEVGEAAVRGEAGAHRVHDVADAGAGGWMGAAE